MLHNNHCANYAAAVMLPSTIIYYLAHSWLIFVNFLPSFHQTSILLWFWISPSDSSWPSCYPSTQQGFFYWPPPVEPAGPILYKSVTLFIRCFLSTPRLPPLLHWLTCDRALVALFWKQNKTSAPRSWCGLIDFIWGTTNRSSLTSLPQLLPLSQSGRIF